MCDAEDGDETEEECPIVDETGEQAREQPAPTSNTSNEGGGLWELEGCDGVVVQHVQGDATQSSDMQQLLARHTFTSVIVLGTSAGCVFVLFSLFFFFAPTLS